MQHQPFLPGTAASAFTKNFIRFSVFFALNHGCVSAVLNLSVIILGDAGAYQSGALYITYALTALLAAPALLALFGTRLAIIVASFTYCIYIISLPLALLAVGSPNLLTSIAILGGAIGGIAAGFLWSAQGAYFATTAKLFSEASDDFTLQRATARFATIFASIFLGFELLLRAVPLVLRQIEHAQHADGAFTMAPPAMPPPSSPPPNQLAMPPSAYTRAAPSLATSEIVVAVVYSVIGILSAGGMLTIRDLDRPKDDDRPIGAEDEAGRGAEAVIVRQDSSAGRAPTKPAGLSFERVAAAVLLWKKDPVVLLFAPIQITFGLCAALVGYELSGKIVRAAFPSNPIEAASLLSGLVSLVAAVMQVPFGAAASRCGKLPVVLVGLAAFATLSYLVLVLELSVLESEHGLIVLLYVLQGLGRAYYEGTNKALYADSFPADNEAAFANLVLANGLTAAAADFVFPSSTRQGRATACLVAACLAVVASLGAAVVQRRRLRHRVAQTQGEERIGVEVPADR